MARRGGARSTREPVRWRADKRQFQTKQRASAASRNLHTFFKTLAVTLGRGIGWSLSPTSAEAMSTMWQHFSLTLRTLQHVLDEHRALSDILVDGEGLVVGCDEDNHDGRRRGRTKGCKVGVASGGRAGSCPGLCRPYLNRPRSFRIDSTTVFVANHYLHSLMGISDYIRGLSSELCVFSAISHLYLLLQLAHFSIIMSARS